MGTTVISYLYYFGVMRQIFFRPATVLTRTKIPISLLIVLIVCVVGTIALGIAPSLAFDFLFHNFGSFDDFLG